MKNLQYVLFWIAVLPAMHVTGCLPGMLAQGPLHGWQVINATKALDLVQVDESEKFATFHLRNISSEVITAFATSFDPPESGDTITDSQDCSDDEPSCLAPGAVFELRWGPPQSLERHPLRILAVVFQDGTFEGFRARVDFIMFRRLGLAWERERLKGVFAGHVEQDLDDAGLERLTEKIGQRPASLATAIRSLEGVYLPGKLVALQSVEKGGRETRHALFVGLNSARGLALQRLAELKALPVEPEDRSALPPRRVWAFRLLRQRYEDFSTKSRLLYERLNLLEEGKQP